MKKKKSNAITSPLKKKVLITVIAIKITHYFSTLINMKQIWNMK